jgi:hypothetical protein
MRIWIKKNIWEIIIEWLNFFKKKFYKKNNNEIKNQKNNDIKWKKIYKEDISVLDLSGDREGKKKTTSDNNRPLYIITHQTLLKII